MAEPFARIHGGDLVESSSPGSRPSGKVNPKAVESMSEVGYDRTTHQSKGLDQFNGEWFEVVVTKGCGDECPLVHAKRREEWQIPEPSNLPDDEFRRVRDLIQSKVIRLLQSLD
jgi:protein-tyrosine-phosphatase